MSKPLQVKQIDTDVLMIGGAAVTQHLQDDLCSALTIAEKST